MTVKIQHFLQLKPFNLSVISIFNMTNRLGFLSFWDNQTKCHLWFITSYVKKNKIKMKIPIEKATITERRADEKVFFFFFSQLFFHHHHHPIKK